MVCIGRRLGLWFWSLGFSKGHRFLLSNLSKFRGLEAGLVVCIVTLSTSRGVMFLGRGFFRLRL